MATSRVTREDMVEQSVSDFIRNAIFNERQYPPDRVELLDAFEATVFEDMGSLDKNYLALGFNYDDGGVQGELGSTLRRRQYMIEVWVLAQSAQTGRNLANAVREVVDHAQLIPLKDLTDPAAPVIDQLQVDPPRVERQPIPDPKPWQEHIYIVYVPVLDEYYA